MAAVFVATVVQALCPGRLGSVCGSSPFRRTASRLLSPGHGPGRSAQAHSIGQTAAQ